MRSRGRVLVIDDDRDVRGFLGVLLAKHGFEPIVVHDGQTGLDILNKNKDIILVLLDWMMPVMDGIKVLDNLNEQGDYPPVLMLTAKSDSENVLTAIKAGASDYIIKPVNVPIIVDKIRSVLEREKENIQERMNNRKPLNMAATMSLDICHIDEKGCVFNTTFPLENDTIIFIQSDELANRLDLPRGHKFYVKVKECSGSGNVYKLITEFVGLTPKLAVNLKKITIAGGWFK